MPRVLLGFSFQHTVLFSKVTWSRYKHWWKWKEAWETREHKIKRRGTGIAAVGKIRQKFADHVTSNNCSAHVEVGLRSVTLPQDFPFILALSLTGTDVWPWGSLEHRCSHYPFHGSLKPYFVSENVATKTGLLLLLSHFSCVRLCATPSLGFSRQEHRSGLPFPSPVHKSEKWKWSRSVMSDSSRPHGLQPTRLLRPWDFPGKSTGVGCHCLLRRLPYLCSNSHLN